MNNIYYNNTITKRNEATLNYLNKNINIDNLRRYSDTTYTDNNNKIIGRIKHYPFANKEWKDNVYTYNKIYLKELSFKYKLTHRLIKHHFNINNMKDIARSRRMRSLIIRSSSKKIMIAKPEIKQTNDKIIITLYTYDRQKQVLIRNLYYYNRKPYIYNVWSAHYNKKIINNVRYLKLQNKKYIKGLKKRFPYQNIKFKNEMDFFRFRSVDLYRKFLNLNNNFMFLFLFHLLSYFNIKIFIPFLQNTKANKKRNIRLLNNILNKKPEVLILINNNYTKLNILKKNDININVFKSISFQKNLNINQININKEKLNNYLLHFLHNKLTYNKYFSKEQIILLYIRFKNNYYNNIITKYFKHKTKMLSNLTKLELTKFKLSTLLVNLKSFISKIYDKNAELNIVNLKHMYLNSDIYTQFIANKLRKKSNVAKILRRSLKIVKLPYDFIIKHKKDNINDFKELDKYKSSNVINLYNNISKDKLNLVFEKLFPNQLVHNKNINLFKNNKIKTKLARKSKIMSILNTIKHKWVKGIKLEIAGRLTRRNTASRSAFKSRSKGNLNNKQYYLESGLVKSLPAIMLRNYSKTNLQYTLIRSKRRIGAFGVKSWISSY